ncbi:hypothetical protein [Pseudomonas extremaustralis]|uniref:hypothetical protein n=1 Tax=Pseudomonas extremaustralis TaxID=359110 RepID=UPI00285D5104|nr:hypothetical protein [Pseudomonas extremaustralis]MDR6577123.1 hypothetical protein [Pseudomonas extremaustralis]
MKSPSSTAQSTPEPMTCATEVALPTGMSGTPKEKKQTIKPQFDAQPSTTRF